MSNAAAPRKITLPIYAFVFAVALFPMAKLVWKNPSIHLLGVIGITIAILAFIVQYLKVRKTYRSLAGQTDENPDLKKAVRCMMESFGWGIILFLASTQIIYMVATKSY